MITFKNGDIFSTKCDYIVIPVNCGGVAGAGLAEQFKLKYPDKCKQYVDACNRKSIQIGGGTFTIIKEGDVFGFMFFPTKDFWYNDSKVEHIEKGLNSCRDSIKALNIKSIAFPAVGCGFGVLNWEAVKPLMVEKLKDLDCEIEIYEAQPEREKNDRKFIKKMNKSSDWG